jgi:hypothetical protein
MVHAFSSFASTASLARNWTAVCGCRLTFPPDQLALTVGDQSIEADGNDMTRFPFRVLDAY